MRIHGRRLYPSSLSERRALFALGGNPTLRVPRGTNPYMVSRKVVRAARNSDLLLVRDVLARKRKPKPPEPRPSPDLDIPEDAAVAGGR